MKNLIIVLLLAMLTPICTSAQNRAINKFYRTFKKGENVRNIALPGPLTKLGVGIARMATKDDEVAQASLKLLKKVKGMKLMAMEDHNLVTPKAYRTLVDGVAKKGFEPAIVVNAKGNKIDIHARTKNGKFKNMLILISAEDSFVMMSVKANMQQKDIGKLINLLMEDEMFDEEKIPEEKPKPKLPQA